MKQKHRDIKYFRHWKLTEGPRSMNSSNSIDDIEMSIKMLKKIIAEETDEELIADAKDFLAEIEENANG